MDGVDDDGVGWESGRRGTRELFLALLRSKTFVAGAIILVFWIVDAIFWPLIVPQDPEAILPERRSRLGADPDPVSSTSSPVSLRAARPRA